MGIFPGSNRCPAAAAFRAIPVAAGDVITFPKRTRFQAGIPTSSARSARPFITISSTSTWLGHARSHRPHRRQSVSASCTASASPSSPRIAASIRAIFPRATAISAFRSG